MVYYDTKVITFNFDMKIIALVDMKIITFIMLEGRYKVILSLENIVKRTFVFFFGQMLSFFVILYNLVCMFRIKYSSRKSILNVEFFFYFCNLCTLVWMLLQF